MRTQVSDCVRGRNDFLGNLKDSRRNVAFLPEYDIFSGWELHPPELCIMNQATDNFCIFFDSADITNGKQVQKIYIICKQKNEHHN